jgi:hypothetical protein
MKIEFPDTLLLPLQQSRHYARALKALGASVDNCPILQGGTPVGWCQIQSRRMHIFGKVRMISRGPIWPNRASDASGEWLLDLCEEHPNQPLLLNAETTYMPLRRLGFWPLMTGVTVAVLPLSDTAQMRARLSQKWRNRLVRSENSPLSVRSRNFDGDPAHWLMVRERQQKRHRGYSALPAAFTTAYAAVNAGGTRQFTAFLNKKPVAAMLFLRHGRMASYHMGHALPAARQHNAHNLLMWQAMLWLSQNGHDSLDLGTVNTQDAPGIARFKLGTGADAKRLGGTWLHLGRLAPIARRLPDRFAA